MAGMKRGLKIAISCVYYALSRPVIVLAKYLGVLDGTPLVILYYHDVPTASLATFTKQMGMLARRATVVGADWRGGPTKGRVCAITFDDAFVSVFENALPVLKRHEFPCTIFVPTGFMGRVPSWNAEANSVPREAVASEDVIRAMTSPDVTIGAHTVSHPRLSRISEASARHEVERARSVLETLTGRSIRLMSFPYGDHNDSVTSLCKEAGYDFVYGIEPKRVSPRSGEFFRGRVSVGPSDGSLEFFLKVSGGYAWMSLASMLKQTIMASYARVPILGRGVRVA
jgi:peptidoglycan/xylan/chitin deacetylase (PgdA/CDA1 family)